MWGRSGGGWVWARMGAFSAKLETVFGVVLSASGGKSGASGAGGCAGERGVCGAARSVRETGRAVGCSRGSALVGGGYTVGSPGSDGSAGGGGCVGIASDLCTASGWDACGWGGATLCGRVGAGADGSGTWVTGGVTGGAPACVAGGVGGASRDTSGCEMVSAGGRVGTVVTDRLLEAALFGCGGEIGFDRAANVSPTAGSCMPVCSVRVTSAVAAGAAASLCRSIAPRRWSARISSSRVWLEVCRTTVMIAAGSREVAGPSPLSGRDVDGEALIGASALVTGFSGAGGIGQRQAALSVCVHAEASFSRAAASGAGAGAEPSGTPSTVTNRTVAAGSLAASRTAVSARIATNSPSEAPSCGACRAGGALIGWTCGM